MYLTLPLDRVSGGEFIHAEALARGASGVSLAEPAKRGTSEFLGVAVSLLLIDGCRRLPTLEARSTVPTPVRVAIGQGLFDQRGAARVAEAVWESAGAGKGSRARTTGRSGVWRSETHRANGVPASDAAVTPAGSEMPGGARRARGSSGVLWSCVVRAHRGDILRRPAGCAPRGRRVVLVGVTVRQGGFAGAVAPGVRVGHRLWSVARIDGRWPVS